MPAKLDFGRSRRVRIDRPATLRDIAKMPMDATLDNLSNTGCLVVTDANLSAGASISIGIPGVGICFARVGRVDAPRYGCAFAVPISDADIEAAAEASTLIDGPFKSLSGHLGGEFELEEHERFSRPLRIGIIVGSSLALWGAILTAIIAAAR